MICSLCPRRCNTDRSKSVGFCGVSETSYIARAALHMWEEPCISGAKGSGTIFFCGCNLRCIFCQNHEISTRGKIPGAIAVDAQKTAEIMLALQKAGAHNVNFVTPTPHIPLIADAIQIARAEGLIIPIAFNTNSYVEVDSLKILDGLVDIYIPDFKYVTPELAKLVSGAEDYPEKAESAIAEMLRQVGHINFDENGMAKRGVLLRHLVLPGNIDETRRVLARVAEIFSSGISLSLMSQYFPAHKALSVPPFDRKLLPREYKRAVDYALSIGFSDVYTQKLSSAQCDFVPEWGVIIK